MGKTQLAALIARAKAGDGEAWGQVYGEYAAAIFRFCRRVLPSREDAEDATTEIFMKLREKFGQYDESKPFSSWLYRIAANHCWDTLRRRHVRQDLETGDVEELPVADAAPDPLEQVMAAHSSGEVRAALAKLPPRSRMALTLRYYSEMEYSEIAEVLSLRPAMVGVVLLRARQQLREAFLSSAAAAGGPA